MRTCKVCGKSKEDSEFYSKVYTCKRCVCQANSKKAYEKNLRLYPDIEGEIWKVASGHPNYLVSNIGRIREPHGRINSPTKHRQGYLRVSVDGKELLVHRLVAETFIPNPDGKATVNHINANKADNRVENLEWATQSENNTHAVRMNLRHFTKKMWEQCTKGRCLSKRQVKEIKTKYQNGVPQHKIADEYHVSRAQICRIVNGKSRNSVFKSNSY